MSRVIEVLPQEIIRGLLSRYNPVGLHTAADAHAEYLYQQSPHTLTPVVVSTPDVSANSPRQVAPTLPFHRKPPLS